MPKFYNAFIGDIRWFAGEGSTDSLRQHIRYITRGHAPTVVRGVTGTREFIRKCAEELDVRYDARIAGKFFLTLPNDLSEPERFIEAVISELDVSEYIIAIHAEIGRTSGKMNLHAHVVLGPRRRDGRKVRIGPTELRSLHRGYRAELAKLGYTVVEQRRAKPAPIRTQAEPAPIKRAKPKPNKRAKPAPIDTKSEAEAELESRRTINGEQKGWSDLFDLFGPERGR